TGSTGVDMETAIDVTLLNSEVALVDSTLDGPQGHGLSALLIGRSSISRRGIFIVPGLIDADCKGKIKIMVYTLTPPVSIPAGSKIAQLIPFFTCVPKAEPRERGQGGFGSTGEPNMLLALDITKGKPQEWVQIHHPSGQTITLSMLIDTGAEVTIVS
ncbi:DUT nucleotidohydrolase, partial [Steatornis caripensis]|nr:DUT nucleotidohydrolase [Steatornis caripensis]